MAAWKRDKRVGNFMLPEKEQGWDFKEKIGTVLQQQKNSRLGLGYGLAKISGCHSGQ